eukprot:9470757-Heterocapsa_arctica.AAC.1
MSTIHKTRGEHPQPWNHVTHLDNEIMEAEICTSTTTRMRPGELTMEVPDMEEMIIEEQDEEMKEHIAAVRSHAEIMAMGGEPIR